MKLKFINLKKVGLNSIYYNIDLIFFVVVITVKMLFYGKFINPIGYTFGWLCPPILASVLIFTGINIVFKRKHRINLLFLLNTSVSFILFADSIYFLYFKDITTVGIIRNSFLLKDVSSSVTSLLKPVHFLYFVDLVLILPFIKYYKKCFKDEIRISRRIRYAVAVILVGVLLNFGYFNLLEKEQPGLFVTMSNKMYIAKVLGNLNYHVADAYNYIGSSLRRGSMAKGREEEIKTFLANKMVESNKHKKGVGANKNLIVIQVEALQQFVIGRKIDNKEITPSLNKWIKKSLYFDNFYYQVAAGNTSDAEFMVNNSLYPAASGAAYYRYSNVTYSSLSSKLKEKGYYTSAMHGNSEGFWNRGVMYKSMQFDNFFGEAKFDMTDKIGMGLSDKSLYEQALSKIDNFKKPFYNFMVTLSSHHPYDAAGVFDGFDVGALQSTMLGKYIQAIHYADEQLGGFMDNLEKKGYLKDSIIVIYGDHHALPKQNDGEIFKYLGKEDPDEFTWFQQQKVPFLIHFPKDEHKGTNHNICGHMDVLPTLSKILDLEGGNYFGKNMSSDEDRLLVFRNGSFIKDKTLYISSSDTYYDITNGIKLELSEELRLMREEAQRQLNYSDDILNHDLLGKFFLKTPEVKN